MEPPRVALARAIVARRAELDLSVGDAAARANISAISWRLIESGTTLPSLLTLGAVCRALDWTSETIESLLHGELRFEGGEVVVDLGDAEIRECERADSQTLDVEGLTRAQLAVVQALIDELRGSPRRDD